MPRMRQAITVVAARTIRPIVRVDECLKACLESTEYLRTEWWL
jgi:hypothetical protein